MASTPFTHFVHTLQARGLIESVTWSASPPEPHPTAIYVGIDPSADAIHVGNLLGIVVLKWAQAFGLQPYLLLGGATGMIGDPGGKSAERLLLDKERVACHVASICGMVQRWLAPESAQQHRVEIVNNADWFGEISAIDFLRDIGKSFRISTMLARDTVKQRLSTEEGMSYTEFSYPLLQSYDFWYLSQKKGVTLQGGGSDQWGNITAGCDFGRRRGQLLHGITWPLLTDKEGRKIGKSDTSGVLWLDPKKLSPYHFYQSFWRFSDEDAERLLCALTFLSIDAIAELVAQTTPNRLQKKLAQEVTRFVHGAEGLALAEQSTAVMQPGSKLPIDAALIRATASAWDRVVLDTPPATILEALCLAGLSKSKGEARRLVAGGGVRVNHQPWSTETAPLAKEWLEKRWLVVGVGKHQKKLLELKAD